MNLPGGSIKPKRGLLEEVGATAGYFSRPMQSQRRQF